MEKAAVIKIREIFKKATFTMNNRKDGKKATFYPIIHIVLDNSVNIYSSEPNYIDSDGVEHFDVSTIIWDDENELLYWFRANTPSTIPNSPSSGMSQSHKSQFPLVLLIADYGEIQNMRIILNEEAFDNLCDGLGDLISEEQKANIYRNFFEETDQSVIISRKREINYNTGLPKKYDPRYTEDSAYVITNHSDQSGGV